jgi:two-component system sensor histidine kinase UhpB
VALSFVAAVTTMGVCYVLGTDMAPISAEEIMVVAVALTCFTLTGGALASSSTARALGLARSQQQDLAEGERRQRKRMLEAQEKERGAIARELHDDFGQLLTAVRLTLESGRAAEAIGQVDEALARIRNLALSLRPAALDDLGLHESLRSFVARQSGRAGFDVGLVFGGATARLPEPIETACFRLVQEALTNVARHAAARNVHIRLEASDSVAELSIVDDGRGFDVAAARARAAAGQSLGLIGMEERVALAGGQLEVTSSAGQGTALRARFRVRGPA